MKQPLAIAAGLALVLVVHGAFAGFYLAYRQDRVSLDAATLQSERALQQQRLRLCGDTRCPLTEARQRRRGIEEPVRELEILEAALIPALGGVAPDPKRLPEIEAYQELQKVEDAINLENPDPRLDRLVKTERPRRVDNPLDHRSDLAKLLEDYESDDPRARRKEIDKITGFRDGEIGGSGNEQRLGNIYSRRAARAISDEFRVPPFLDEATLQKLRVRVRVSRLSFDGAIQEYTVTLRSGDRTFDDAAIAAIRRFSAVDGGSRRLPTPEPEVLRYINSKGLVITLEGRLLRR